MRYILYTRKSSESEDRQVQSIDDQLKALRTLAATLSLQVVREFAESKSAKAPGHRPSFDTMLEMLRRREADGILCWAVNRLSRNPEESGILMGMLQRGELRSIRTMDREYLPEDNVLLLTFESGVANQYIVDLRRSTQRGTDSKVEKGWFPHRAPEGYVNDTATRTVVPDGNRFTLMRRAWDLLLTGAYPVSHVRDQLMEWGFQTKKSRNRGGGDIARSALYRVFRNPFYCGFFRHAGQLHRGSHQQMVSQAEFDRAQRILDRDLHAQPQRNEFAFTGLITCGICGCLVTAEEKVKHYPGTGRTATYRYYHCTGNKGCRRMSVSEAYIDGKVCSLLERCRISPQVRSWILERLAGLEEAERSGVQAEQKEREHVLATARRRLDRLFEMRQDGEIGRAEFQDHKERIETEIAMSERAAATAQERAVSQRQSINNALDFCVDAYERFTGGQEREKRQVAAILGSKYVLTLGNLEIEPHPLLCAIGTFEPVKSESLSSKRTQPYDLSPIWGIKGDYIRTLLGAPYLEFPALISFPAPATGWRTTRTAERFAASR